MAAKAELKLTWRASRMSVPESHLLTAQEVAVLLGVCRQTIYPMMKTRGLPRPLKLSGRCVRWKRDEVLQWLDNLPRSNGAAG